MAREGAVVGTDVLSTKERTRIDTLRRGIVSMRRELRSVQHALREDIEQLDATLKFLNIGAMPIVLALLSLLAILVQRVRRRAAI